MPRYVVFMIETERVVNSYSVDAENEAEAAAKVKDGQFIEFLEHIDFLETLEAGDVIEVYLVKGENNE